jgi:hypothetical protein
MPKQQSDNLISLIHSLTKAEKRNFRLFANRQSSTEEKLFIQLFDYIEGAKNFSEEELLRKYPQIKKSQLSNIKANLYKQLLSSLRLLHRSTFEDIAAREMLDSARILYSKGMYVASLDMLEKSKKLALQIQDHALAYTAIDFERKIENQYITGSMSQKAELLKTHGDEMVETLGVSNELSNLSLLLYGHYLKYGFVKDKKDYEYVTEYFTSRLPKVLVKDLKFFDKIYYFQSYVWYYNVVQDFANYYKFSQKWVDAFRAEPAMIKRDAALYIKGMHNALNALYMASKRDKFITYFDEYKSWGEKNIDHFTTNDLSVYYLIQCVHQLNKVFLTGRYDQGVSEIKEVEQILKVNKYNWDENRIIVFYYKIACVYFGADNYSKALTYLNYIINNPNNVMRLDIQCFARILSLIAHFELGNDVLVSYQIKSVYRYLSNLQDLQAVQKEMLSFLRKTPKIYKVDLKNEFKKLRAKLLQYKNDPYEKRPFLYLDIISWLDSKINGTRVQVEIQKKLKTPAS